DVATGARRSCHPEQSLELTHVGAVLVTEQALDQPGLDAYDGSFSRAGFEKSFEQRLIFAERRSQQMRDQERDVLATLLEPGQPAQERETRDEVGLQALERAIGGGDQPKVRLASA